ncbi:g-protein coupled receptor [Holotrichia oblita]|uniref:G-protein coupled receptor n=1 Tax=Holotrichia oblita TaxID=644536 RepID=A0ACB9SN11_HOLOL|nr:g-protein coupled receptor [Holotrichia oblita]
MDYSNIIYSFITSTGSNGISNSSDNIYSTESLGYITIRQRSIFFAFFLLLYIAAVLGNATAIFITCRRKHRYIQKTLVISLALSDLVMATGYTIQYLNTFAHSLLSWTMGEAMCFLLSFMQPFSILASSGAILIIALDRYRTAVHATMRRWNPNLWRCLIGIAFLWAMAIGFAYPTQLLIEFKEVTIVSVEEDDNASYMSGYVCVVVTENTVTIYYICVIVIVFLPLTVVVFWLQYHIFMLVYKRNAATNAMRKLSTTAMQSSRDIAKGILRNNRPPNRNIQAERKIRIFKIILFLIVAFIACRLPHWIYKTIRVAYTEMENSEWITAFSLNGLVFFNCILNPFLYAFLPQTLTKMATIWKTVSDFTCEVCCCCCSNSEFEQFERENPFSRENFDKQTISKQFNCNQKVKFGDSSNTQDKDKY